MVFPGTETASEEPRAQIQAVGKASERRQKAYSAKHGNDLQGRKLFADGVNNFNAIRLWHEEIRHEDLRWMRLQQLEAFSR